MLVSKAIADKLKTNTLYNTITLHSPDGSFEDITGESIVLDSFSLENEIVEKELKFGGCIASEMSVKLIDYDCSALIGKTVQVILTATYLEDELYPSDDLYPSKTLILPSETGMVECPVFYGKIQSAQRDKKQRNITEITAYDAFYDMSKVDMSLWFAGKEAEDGSFGYGYAHYAKNETFKHLYSALYDKWEDYGVEAVSYLPELDILSLPLNFDDACVEKVIKDITLTDLIQAYMELTLSFAMIEPKNGNLEFLPLYGSKSADTVDSYKDLSFEDYELEPICMYQTKYANKRIFKKGNSNDYSWYISDNILMRCRTTAGDIAEKYNNKNLFGDNHKYRPAKIKLFSYWWLEAGDKYTVQTPFADLPTIETFVFNKKMSGFTTTLTSKGEKRLGKEVKENE
nr:hypothetical protein [uncultured Ruminococcus sp.]